MRRITEHSKEESNCHASSTTTASSSLVHAQGHLLQVHERVCQPVAGSYISQTHVCQGLRGDHEDGQRQDVDLRYEAVSVMCAGMHWPAAGSSSVGHKTVTEILPLGGYIGTGFTTDTDIFDGLDNKIESGPPLPIEVNRPRATASPCELGVGIFLVSLVGRALHNQGLGDRVRADLRPRYIRLPRRNIHVRLCQCLTWLGSEECNSGNTQERGSLRAGHPGGREQPDQVGCRSSW